MRRPSFTALAALASLATACAVADGPDPGADGDDVTAMPRRTMNSLGENRVSDHAATLKRIVATKFAANADTLALARTSQGQQLLDYAARCALKPGAQVSIGGYVVPQAPSLGLAPSWTSRALTTTEQGWLMACLLTHINATGSQVALSVRGRHVALAADVAERADYPIQEGAFWGAFSNPNPDSSGLVQYACFSDELASKCGPAQAAAILWDRLCAHGGCKDLYVVGACSSFDPADPVTCDAPSSGRDYYTACYPQAALPGKQPAGTRVYKEVITTYLKDFPACD